MCNCLGKWTYDKIHDAIYHQSPDGVPCACACHNPQKEHQMMKSVWPSKAGTATVDIFSEDEEL